MKKIISIILALAMCLSAVALLASCAGESAYEIAVRNGFEGTEQEWLESLKGQNGTDGKDGADGKDGTDGKDGADGKDGVDGAPGKDGADGKDGANGKDGKDGADAQAGKDGRAIEFQVTDTHVQWRYVGETEWTNLLPLESIKGEDGKDGENGKDGADGNTPFIGEDGCWWIGDINTGVPAQGTGEGGTSSTTLTVKEMWLEATEFNVWGHWSADKAAKLVLHYVLSNDRTGKTDVTSSMVTGTYDLSKGGTYPITVKFLGSELEATLKVTSYTVQTVFPKTLAGYDAPALMLETKLPDGTTDTRDATEIMTGSVNFYTPGKYPVTIQLEGIEAESFDITVEEMMVYFENFDALTDKSMAEIFAATGFKIPVPGDKNSTHYHDGVGTWFGGSALSDYVVYGMFHRPNYFEISVKEGKLYYTSRVKHADVVYTGMTDSALILVDNDYMSVAGKDVYTVQFDVTTQLVSVNEDTGVPKYSTAKDTNAIIGVKYSGQTGTSANAGRPQILGVALAGANLYAKHTRYNGSHNYTGNTTDILTTLFGDTELTAWGGEYITVRMVVRPDATKEDYGYDVYVKQAGASDDEFVKLYTVTSADTAVKSMYALADNNAIAIHYRSVANDTWTSYDNIAVWTGTGDMPTITNTDAYEALIATPAE